MRGLVVIGAVFFVWSADAWAQRAPATKGQRSFLVKLKKIADDCAKNKVVLPAKAVVTLTRLRRRAGRLVIGRGQVMTGTIDPRRGFTMTMRRRGAVITASGRVRGGRISMLVIAEHYRGKNPVCTQTWNATGLRHKLRRKP